MITRPHPVSDFLGTLFDFLTTPGIELFVSRVYSDGRGIPTLGVGYAMVIERNGTWVLRDTLNADLAAIGITLSDEQRGMLNQAINVLNGGSGTNPIPRWPGGENVMGFVITVGNARTLFDRIIGEYQQRVQDMLGTEAYNQLSDSSEMVALVSLAYNNVIKAGGTGTPNLREAILNDNRAEAWYEIRYQSNSLKQPASIRTGIANRRYRESNLFSLSDAGSLTEDQEKAQAKEVMRMYSRYRTDIEQYELKFPPTAVAQTSVGNQISYAEGKLIEYYSAGKTIDGEVIVGAGLVDYGVDNTSLNDMITNSPEGTTQNRPGNFNDLIFGEDGNDTIFGGGGNDVIYGGDGNDDLFGGLGDDLLYGGEGNDTYFINPGEGTDTIEDKQGANRVVFLGKTRDLLLRQSDGTYKTPDGAVTATVVGTDLILTDVATGQQVKLNENFADGDFGIHLRDSPTDPAPTNTIYGDRQSLYTPPQYDSLGNEITDLNVVQAGKNDRLYDSAGNDRIEGGGGNDEIWALNGGDDLLLGGAGQDNVSGQSGNDRLEGGADSDVVAGGLGDDQVFGENAGEMEEMIAAGEVAPSVNQRGDLVIGNAGDDYLYGANGKDVFFGGAGHDLIVGGGGDDIIFGDIDCTLATIDWTATVGPGYSVSLTNMNTLVTAFPGNDVIYAGTGNDLVYAGGGDDEVYAGQGDDFVGGEEGDDSIFGGDGDDYLGGDASNIAVALHGNDYIDGGGGNDQIYGEGGADTLFGGDGDDGLYGDDAGMVVGGGDDYLDGKAGIDFIVGGMGNDTMFGGSGNDQLFGDGDDIAEIYHGDDYIDGEEGNDIISGYGGADTLIGGIGNDLIFGGAGDDEIYGDDGDDELQGGAGNDYIEGGTGNNTIWGEDGDDTIFVDDGTNQLVGGAGNDYIEGGLGADSIWGDDGDDTIFGGDGVNQIVGGLGSDYIEGGLDGDNIWGDEGDDTVYGNEGDDTLYGNAGNDFLDGGSGNDTLSGGLGADRYVFEIGSGQDTIDDWYEGDPSADAVEFGEGISSSDLTLFKEGNDLKIGINGTTDSLTIINWFGSTDYRVGQFAFADGTILTSSQLESLGFLIEGTAGADTLSGSSLNELMYGYDGNDELDGFGGDDILDGGLGDDSLYGGDGNDQLIGGEGNENIISGDLGDDLIIGGIGNDWTYGGDGNDTYIFGRGSGQDRIQEFEDGGEDTLQLGEGILPSDIVLARDMSDRYSPNIYHLYMTINGTEDQIWFFEYFHGIGVEQIQFADGTAWDELSIREKTAINGTDGNDSIFDVDYWSADDYFKGLGGDDFIQGRLGNDIFDGGTGNDTLIDYSGNEIYLFDRGGGQDTITDVNGTDSIRMGAGVSPSDITLVRDTNDPTDLIISINGTGDMLRIESYWEASGAYAIENVLFTDGTTWDKAFIDAMPILISGTDGDDYIVGDSEKADWIQGLAGNDSLIGWGGDDILDGGSGDDYLQGDSGDDTYLFGSGSGRDIIYDVDETPGNVDTIKMAAGVTPIDVEVSRDETDLRMSINGTNDALDIFDWFIGGLYGGDDFCKIERVQFEDGTVWGIADVEARISYVPSEGADYLVGTAGNDVLSGLGGDDNLYGIEGDDTLIGGLGNDYIDGGSGTNLLDGGPGNDTLIGNEGIDEFLFGRGYGIDIINGTDNSDTVQIGADVLPSDIILSNDGHGYDLSFGISGTSDTLVILEYLDPTGEYLISQFRFDDGTVWAAATILGMNIQITGTSVVSR